MQELERQLSTEQQKFTQESEAMKNLHQSGLEKLQKKLQMAQNERKTLEAEVRRVSEQLASCERQLLRE